MFTGIVETVGKIVEVGESGGFRQLKIHAPGIRGQIRTGASILTDGVCITARELTDTGFVADLSRETLERTTFGSAAVGAHVNLEQAMKADSRFGGHIVQGHVDEVGRISRFEQSGDEWILEIRHSEEAASRLVWKGSVAVDGISLTVADLADAAFSIAIIPYTLEHTTLRYRKAGDAVNLEFDVLAKYVEKLIEPYIEQFASKSWDSRVSKKPS